MTATAKSTDMSAAVKAAIAADMRESKLSREEIAMQLSGLAGRKITEHQLDAYAAPTKDGYRFPAELVGAWFQVTGSRRLVDVLCAAAGFVAADETERELAEYARVQIRQEKMQAEAAQRRSELWARV